MASSSVETVAQKLEALEKLVRQRCYSLNKQIGTVEKSLEDIKDMLKKLNPSPAPKADLQVEYFFGNLQPTPFLDWLASMEHFFARNEMSEEDKVSFATLKLKGPARRWWGSLREPAETWEEMRLMLLNHYLPCEMKALLKYDYVPGQPMDIMKNSLTDLYLPRDTMYWKMLRLKQKDKTVKEYTKDFLDFRIHNNITETEPEKITWFCTGLRPEIKNKMYASGIRVSTLDTLDTAYQLALKVEESLNLHSDGKTGLPKAPV